ncbi:DUF3787 domain-containing protein [Clostridium sp. D2Q-14]|uniref:CDIF630_02480 family spore surface protein n=1 Tax=Anaeromonas gelatinilytica TaxID=2683194 RepID=UPI00193BA7B2|nr:DUF3787 domain-containing protein [Anaeromonas gelatinilytica]MBS4534179.1 DUF3787 domain-containing protein [Anaeromonas gelatinilytica]
MKKYNKENIHTEPIERNITAAWANIDKLKKISRVPIPNKDQVEDAKDYVDKNQK